MTHSAAHAKAPRGCHTHQRAKREEGHFDGEGHCVENKEDDGTDARAAENEAAVADCRSQGVSGCTSGAVGGGKA